MMDEIDCASGSKSGREFEYLNLACKADNCKHWVHKVPSV